MRSPDPVTDYAARLERCAKFLPAWFVPRMMDDTWVFGLLLSTGPTLAIEHIDNVSQAADGSLWVDVTMHTRACRGAQGDLGRCCLRSHVASPGKRQRRSHRLRTRARRHVKPRPTS
jgi:hypothetical protein